MKRYHFFCSVACVILFGGFIFSPENATALTWERKGEVFTRTYQEASDDNAYEDAQAYDTRLRLENTIEFSEQRAALTVNGELRYEAFAGDEVDDDVDVLLREAFLEVRRENYSVRLGRQTVTWGTLDNVVVLDQVSPQSYRWFVLDDKEKRKEPHFLLQCSYFTDTVQLEGIYLPFFKPSDVSYFGPGWSVFGRLQKAVADGTAYTASQKAAVSGIKIDDTDTLSGHRFEDGEVGLRVKSKTAQIDFGVYYFYFHNRVPVLQENTAVGNTVKTFLFVPTDANLDALVALNPTSADLTLFKKYERLHMAGFDFETVVREFGVRGEVGLFFDLPYLRGDLSYTRKNTAIAGIGIDHTTENNLYINLQFIETAIMDYSPLFVQEEYTHQITAELTKDFLRGHVLCSFDSAFNISNSDWMINPEVRYKFDNGFEIAAGEFWFNGALTTLFGRYAERDVIYLEGKLSF